MNSSTPRLPRLPRGWVSLDTDRRTPWGVYLDGRRYASPAIAVAYLQDCGYSWEEAHEYLRALPRCAH